MSQVAVQHLDKVYQGQTHVLKDLSLEIDSGEFLVLLGPSGCGKSTLLNCIAGLLEVEGGRVEIAGKDVTNSDPSERGIAMVFQSYALYPTKTVYGNMAFCLRMKRKSKEFIDQKVKETAELLQIRAQLRRILIVNHMDSEAPRALQVQRPVIDGKAERFHQMQMRPRGQAEPADVAGVRRDLRLDEDDVQHVEC